MNTSIIVSEMKQKIRNEIEKKNVPSTLLRFGFYLRGVFVHGRWRDRFDFDPPSNDCWAESLALAAVLIVRTFPSVHAYADVRRSRGQGHHVLFCTQRLSSIVLNCIQIQLLDYRSDVWCIELVSWWDTIIFTALIQVVCFFNGYNFGQFQWWN